MSKAREAAVRKAVKACFAAADAMSKLLEHLPAERADDQRRRLVSDLNDWASHMEKATWWKGASR